MDVSSPGVHLHHCPNLVLTFVLFASVPQKCQHCKVRNKPFWISMAQWPQSSLHLTPKGRSFIWSLDFRIITFWLFYSKVDEKQIFKYAHHLARIGVKGVYILGTTGESYSLAIGEKILLVKTWRTALDEVFKETGKKIVAIVNISATCVNEIHCLATLVDSLQFDGLALLPPIYYRINNCKQLIGYINSIVGKHASTIPFLYYHIPSFTGELACKLKPKIQNQLPQSQNPKFLKDIDLLELLKNFSLKSNLQLNSSNSLAKPFNQYHSFVQ